LRNGWVFCRIRSWLTGRRIVSLPFSDHCDPLLEDPEDLEEISCSLKRGQQEDHCRYIEYRFASKPEVPQDFERYQEFCLHKLDLQPSLEDLFHGLQESSTQRKIRRAEREALRYQEGSSEALLQQFYQLLVLTRRRHHVPPQPRKWFSSLVSYFGNQIRIRVAFNKETPVASIITLRFKNTLVYKYGGADDRFFPLGGMQMLLWRAIVEAKQSQLREFDLGRSDLQAKGLIVFKDRVGAERSSLCYFRYPGQVRSTALSSDRMFRRRKLLSYIPGRVITAAGRLLYRHFG
jgi:lipid II:glycine glycyltransferase (peptidoglycan interpeptide bridge formation enzyme)